MLFFVQRLLLAHRLLPRGLTSALPAPVEIQTPTTSTFSLPDYFKVGMPQPRGSELLSLSPKAGTTCKTIPLSFVLQPTNLLTYPSATFMPFSRLRSQAGQFHKE
jgi:hypothetical protein